MVLEDSVTYVKPNGDSSTFDIDEAVENSFGFHPATDESRELHIEARQHFIWLGSWCKANLPAGREQAVVITKLQEALMFTNASIAINLAPLGSD